MTNLFIPLNEAQRESQLPLRTLQGLCQRRVVECRRSGVGSAYEISRAGLQEYLRKRQGGLIRIVIINGHKIPCEYIQIVAGRAEQYYTPLHVSDFNHTAVASIPLVPAALLIVLGSKANLGYFRGLPVNGNIIAPGDGFIYRELVIAILSEDFGVIRVSSRHWEKI